MKGDNYRYDQTTLRRFRQLQPVLRAIELFESGARVTQSNPLFNNRFFIRRQSDAIVYDLKL